VGRLQVRFVNGGGSYLSASDRRVLVGFGSGDQARVSVWWPSGREQSFAGLASWTYWRLTEGRDAPEKLRPGN
jgi:hypothetical protein